MKYHCRVPRTIMGYMILLGIFLLFLVPHQTEAALPGPRYQTPVSFANLADSVKHSVVNISTTQVVKGAPVHPFFGHPGQQNPFSGNNFFKHFFGNIPRGEMKTHALGSGFVISRKGFILTNNHVIAHATQIKVKLDTGKEYDAKVVGRDPKTDLALIKVKPDADFPRPVVLGNSDAIRVGDWVMAVGNPFGLGQTVTVGIISAKGRIIGAGPYDDFLQTDAAINPGNSGGPLFNMKGEVIGINTAIIAQGQNIGFAIPINIAKELLPQLKKGKIIRGWLGVMIQNLTPELAKSFGLKSTQGALISDVRKNSPAYRAGLKRGDVIVRYQGEAVKDVHTLSRLVAETPPKTLATLDIIRHKKEETVKVKIGTMPEKLQTASLAKKSAWGLTVEQITPDVAQQLGLKPDEQGVVISGVEQGSPAAEAGLTTGDVVKEVNHQEIKNLHDYNSAMSKVNKNEGLLLLIKRGNGTLFVVLKQSSKD